MVQNRKIGNQSSEKVHELIAFIKMKKAHGMR
jgi:hypothetical protein